MSSKEKSGGEAETSEAGAAATEEDGSSDNGIPSSQPQRPITLCKRKLGHAPRSLCLDATAGVGVRGSSNEDQPQTDLNPSTEVCMTPARSVPDMDQMTDSTTHVPYQPLDNSKRGLPGQLSSQTASMASEGSQESLGFCSEQCPPPPPPVSMKALSPSPLARHSGGRGCSSRRSQTSFHQGQPTQAPLTPVWKPIPLITKTGPTGSLNIDGIQNNSSNWITITRQHSQPEPRMLCNCRFCSSDPEAGLQGQTCPSCGYASCRSPTLNVCCENYGYSPCSGRRRSQLSPKRVFSVCGTADDFATIAADSMKITGGFKQFKQLEWDPRKIRQEQLQKEKEELESNQKTESEEEEERESEEQKAEEKDEETKPLNSSAAPPPPVNETKEPASVMTKMRRERFLKAKTTVTTTTATLPPDNLRCSVDETNLTSSSSMMESSTSAATAKNNRGGGHRSHNPKLHKLHPELDNNPDHDELEDDPPHSISIDVPLICSNHHKNSKTVVDLKVQGANSKVPTMSFSAISPVNVEDTIPAASSQNTETVLQSNRVLTTISEQSQLLSPSKLLALQRQSTLSVSQPRLTSSAAGITSPILCGSSVESDLGLQFKQTGQPGPNPSLMAAPPPVTNSLIPGVSACKAGLLTSSARRRNWRRSNTTAVATGNTGKGSTDDLSIESFSRVTIHPGQSRSSPRPGSTKRPFMSLSINDEDSFSVGIENPSPSQSAHFLLLHNV